MHLHVHSHFSLLGGTASVEGLAARAAGEGMSHLALTDTNALYGAVAFSRACANAGVQPILGMALAVQPPLELITLPAGSGSLVLLAMNPSGYRSLCRLSTAIQAHPDRLARAQQGVDWTTLAENRAGLVCISGGRRGWIERALRAGDRRSASRVVSRLAGMYDDKFYLALERHPQSNEDVTAEVLALGERFGVAAVAVQPVYCLGESERLRLRLLAAIDQNCRLEAVPPHMLPDDGDEAIDLHWRSPDEMSALFADVPGALARAGEIAGLCEAALPDGRPIWPKLELPPGETPEKALARQAQAGLEERFGTARAAEIDARLHRELASIARHGFSPLFLLVADVVRYARAQEIPVSTRGSVANSLVAFCVGITTVDPIEHDLLFERFLNPARSSPPDIDLDFCSRRRHEVLDYLRREYGEARVALVATISTMRLKSALRETGKALGLDETAISRLSKSLRRGWHPDPRRRQAQTLDAITKLAKNEAEAEVILRAFEIKGQPHHLSVHPGGLIIAPGPLTEVTPLQFAPKGFLITQFGHEDVEALGLPKLDLLGIRALTVLSDAAELVRKHHDPAFRLESIPLADPDTAAALSRGDTIGVFQCESTGAKRTLRRLQAKTVADLAVANAFFKPGPALGGMARAFERRYRGEAEVRYLHPALEPILARTKGVLIFQEQILRVATEIAGLSWAEADHLRRGMSKFQSDDMKEMAARFIAGCRRPGGPGFSQSQAETLWGQVEPFAGYGFNQGHATAYADVSYRSAYLRTHFPAAFFCARLQDWGGFHHPAIYMAEAVRLGIAVRPPHVNHSGRKFTLAWGSTPAGEAQAILWMGLAQVRDLGAAAVRGLVAARRDRPFSGLRDLLQRVPLQAKEIMHLIQCGALDGLGASRAALLAELAVLQQAGNLQQLAFDFLQVEAEAEGPAQCVKWEKEILGQPVGTHPLDAHPDLRAGSTRLLDITQRAGQCLRVAGVRLPGWTGGKGFYLGDGETYVIAIPGDDAAPAPPAWQPVTLVGRWKTGEWGEGWFQVE